MPGPPPKDPAVRQRRNRKSTRSHLTRNTPARKRAPSLPDLGRDWHDMTVKWWFDVWHSPMSDEFLRADEHGLIRLAVLIDEFWESPSKALASEIRLQQQAFGLTPLDRRRLEWSIEQVEEAKHQRQKREQVEKDEAADPRALLGDVAVVESNGEESEA